MAHGDVSEPAQFTLRGGGDYNKMHDVPSGDRSQKLPAGLARADLEMVALDYFRRLGQDNHHRLLQVCGWEDKNMRTS
jgi:hypothetical protein